MPTQQLSTQLRIDAALGGNFERTFASAGGLLRDMQNETKTLRGDLGKLSKSADDLEKIGESADHIRKDMVRLESAIEKTERAASQFGDADRYFRSAGIGVKALGSDVKSLAKTAATAVGIFTGLGTAAAAALAPSEDVLSFNQELEFSANIGGIQDEGMFAETRDYLRQLSNDYGIAAAEIAQTHTQLVRNLGFEGATETIAAAVEFETITGTGIGDIEDELATARISLGIDTPAETREFLNLLGKAHQQGIKIDNIDLGDMETLIKRTGEDVFGQNFQREFLTTIAFRQVDSFQFADYAQAFQEEISRATLITPNMELKDVKIAQENIAALEKWGIRAEDGIVGAMRAYQQLNDQDRLAFFADIEPVLTAMPAEVIARGSEALPQITAQVNAIMERGNIAADAQEMVDTWSGAWGRIGVIGQNSLGILQEEFAQTFAPDISRLQGVFDFIVSHRDTIRNFFEGVRDTFTPIVEKVFSAISTGLPIFWEFAKDVWGELRAQWEPLAPVAGAIADRVWQIVRAVTGFVRDHPRLVATVISGVAAWKAYRFVSDSVQVGFDTVGGVIAACWGDALDMGKFRAKPFCDKISKGINIRVRRWTDRKPSVRCIAGYRRNGNRALDCTCTYSADNWCSCGWRCLTRRCCVSGASELGADFRLFPGKL